MNKHLLKRTLSCCLAAFLLLGAVGFPVQAKEEEETQEDKMLAPYFVIQNGEEGAEVEHFPLKATNVDVNISGMIAEIYVTQTYANLGSVPINARYVFPAASNVCVHGMEMRIGNERITAQIREKEEAKTVYETAKEEGKTASLMEQKRPNVFTMDVANIMPKDTVTIQLHYTQLITPTDGIYEFVFPTVVGPRYTELTDTPSEDSQSVSDNDWIASPYLPEDSVPSGDFQITVSLSTGVPISQVTCKSHGVIVRQTDPSNAVVTLANSDDYAGNRDFILKYSLSDETIQSGLVLTRGQTQGEAENFFMLTIQPPERYEPEEIVPREYIFVLDISGSMAGYPLDTAKGLIRDLVGNLNESDLFDLVLFSNDTTLLSKNSLKATSHNVKTAIHLIDTLEGGGGTSLLPAMTAASYIPETEGYARTIVVITDGYVSNDGQIIDYVCAHMKDSGFFSFGIGTSVNDYLIKQIAACGLGESFIVTDEEDALDAAEDFRTYIEAPLLTDISVDFQGFGVYDVEPEIPSILYASQPIVLFGKWAGSPCGTISISGRSGEEDYRQEISVADISVNDESEAVRYLWARTHLDRLAGYGSLRNDHSIKEDITKLGLEYNMITPYTSFVAVSEIIRNTTDESRDVQQALPLPQRVSQLAVGGGYRAYSEPESLLPVMVLAVVLWHTKKRAKRKVAE